MDKITTYPQVQAIKPTESMIAQQEAYNACRIGGLVLIVLGGITLATGSSGGVISFGIVSFILGIVLINLAAQFKIKINGNHGKTLKHDTTPYYQTLAYRQASGLHPD